MRIMRFSLRDFFRFETEEAKVVNLYHIYQALEEALEANAEHPLVESLHFPVPLAVDERWMDGFKVSLGWDGWR